MSNSKRPKTAAAKKTSETGSLDESGETPSSIAFDDPVFGSLVSAAQEAPLSFSPGLENASGQSLEDTSSETSANETDETAQALVGAALNDESAPKVEEEPNVEEESSQQSDSLSVSILTSALDETSSPPEGGGVG